MSQSSRRAGVVAGIQARTGSSRLPRKILADLAGRTMIERVVERTRLAASVDKVVVLTTVEAVDDELVALCEARDIPVRRGSEQDVLSRYVDLVAEFQPNYVVRVTGDCPFVEPAFIDLQVAALAAAQADFTELDPEGVDGTLCGMGVKSSQALLAAQESNDPRDREHVGTFFFQGHPSRFRWTPIEVDSIFRREGLRLTVDEPADLEFARAIYTHFVPFGRSADFSSADVIRWLDDNPSLGAINSAVVESAANQELRRLRRVQRDSI
ncbi:MAG: spore coat polysaccharide biosynthesis protein SpsF [Planctomycetota bacterium]|jgi:spore coat polysaccharide biosynthesis protein SpsF